ncbi:hypothetical protein [Streptomyces purpureus]|uniref:hypothetical protein n=1 Tax=Streptomyces purpureus TaxID=1951 RepID=UPI0003603B3C|nr:hypothetical protein [Streptomyces purpureus]
MSTQENQELAPSPTTAPIDVEQAEAALVEHYPRLVRIAYLVLPPSLGRNRRVVTAHAVVQRSLPRRRTGGGGPGAPGPGRPEDAVDPGYAYVRGEVLRQALLAGRPLRRLAWPSRAQFPPLLPMVWGLRVFPRAGGADELALDQRLSALSGAGRAAYVLRGLERQGDAEVRRVLAAAGVAEPDAALAETDVVGAMYALLGSAEFDPCSLQARPPDLMRRRQHARAAVAAAAAVAVCGALLGLPGEGWGPGGAAAPSYARNPASEAALDPGRLRRVAPAVWQRSARTDFTVWPVRGDLTGDSALLRRALAVWARPGRTVLASATPGTPPGPPMGAPQLLFAGRVDAARVVLFHDGLRVVRYAEPVEGAGGAVLDFARTDGADMAASGALVVGRAAGNVRYLTAPWVRTAGVRDLLVPDGAPRPLRRDAHGVTDPVPSPAQARHCRSWDVLEVGDGVAVRLLTDLGELTPARLTWGPPAAPGEVASEAARAAWARTACLLPSVRGHGVRAVNSWQFARQRLPEGGGSAVWLCTRAETWRGTGVRVLAQFQAPSAEPGAPGAVAAKAEESPVCGPRDPRVLAGVLWKARGGQWYVLAAGGPSITSLDTSGGVRAHAEGRLLAARTTPGARAQLTGRTQDGTQVGALR